MKVAEKRRERRPRMRAISEGVSRMQASPLVGTELTSANEFLAPGKTSSSDDSLLGRHERKQRRRLMKCQSEGVAAMRSSLDFTPSTHQRPKLETLNELVNVPAQVCRLAVHILSQISYWRELFPYFFFPGSTSNSGSYEAKIKTQGNFRWRVPDESRFGSKPNTPFRQHAT